MARARLLVTRGLRPRRQRDRLATGDRPREIPGWRFDYTLKERSLPLPQQVAEILARTSEAIVTMRMWPAPDLRVNTHFLSEDAVEFDFDRDDLQGQHQLDLLCGFMRALGRHLGKPVRLTPEGSPHHPLIIYSPTEDRFTPTA
jgi:hypothetical protein